MSLDWNWIGIGLELGLDWIGIGIEWVMRSTLFDISFQTMLVILISLLLMITSATQYGTIDGLNSIEPTNGLTHIVGSQLQQFKQIKTQLQSPSQALLAKSRNCLNSNPNASSQSLTFFIEHLHRMSKRKFFIV